MKKKPKRDPATEDDLRGWVEGAKLDSSSLRLERIGRSDRWKVIIEGEVIAELGKEHRRLIYALIFIGEEHRAGIELAARKLAHQDVSNRILDENRPAKMESITPLVRAWLQRKKLGKEDKPLRSYAKEWRCSASTIYRARDLILIEQERRK